MFVVKKIRLVHPYSGLDPSKAKAVKKEIDRYKLLSHDHLIKYYGCEIIENNVFCIYLEYMAGKSIAESLLADYGKIKESLCRDYVYQVLLALEYLHS